MLKYLIICLFVSVLGLKVSAQENAEGEILYITDQLRLSLYESASENSKILEYLTSGDRLDVTRTSGPYVFVNTDSGKKGWVKRGFLVSKVPTVTLLNQELEKTETLAEELNKLSNSSQIIDQYETDMDVLSMNLKAETEAKEAAQTELEVIKEQVAEKQKKDDLAVATSNHEAEAIDVLVSVFLGYWRYLLPICLAFILIGFIIARKMLEARMKKKFQGVKVW